MLQYINADLIHPATRSGRFKNKAFTENAVSNIIKLCCGSDSFIIEHGNSIYTQYGENGEPEEADIYLKLVIDGYYIEVHTDRIPQGAKYFFITKDDVIKETSSAFAGVSEVINHATLSGNTSNADENEELFVGCASDTSEIPQDAKILFVYENGYDTNKFPGENMFHEASTREYQTSNIIVSSSQPAGVPGNNFRNKLWIDSKHGYVVRVYLETKGTYFGEESNWMPCGSVYKDVQNQ